MHRVVVIGGGPAGMVAAYAAAKKGNYVILIEKNEKLGKKLYITGKGRCNLTTSVEKNDFFSAVVSKPKFLFGAFNNFSNKDVMAFFEENGLALKEERGNRIFPQSDKASDVTKTLEKAIVKAGVDIRLNTQVNSVETVNGAISAVITNKGMVNCDSVIVCTGGCSYPTTGSTGDGYKFATKVGHTVTKLNPSLVGVELKGSDFQELQGLSLKNVSICASCGDKQIYKDFGEMLFTHFGISGPIVLSCSALINKLDINSIKFYIDLKPALDFDVLDKRLVREFRDNNVKTLSTTMRSLLPKVLINVVLRQANVNGNKNCSEITLNERQQLVKTLKSMVFSAKRLRPIEEAIVTSGGVCVKEINPKTMESKLIKGLFFAGEILDLDAFTGGYNLQIAFSTGYTAGLFC